MPALRFLLIAAVLSFASASDISTTTDAAEAQGMTCDACITLAEVLHERWEYSWPRPRVIVLSFPHNPTTACVDLEFMQRVVDFAREHEVMLVHDFAYADIGFDGYKPPSILEVPGAKEVAVELYSMTKSFSMAGWRVAFLAGNPEVVAALAKLKSYLEFLFRTQVFRDPLSMSCGTQMGSKPWLWSIMAMI